MNKWRLQGSKGVRIEWSRVLGGPLWPFYAPVLALPGRAPGGVTHSPAHVPAFVKSG